VTQDLQCCVVLSQEEQIAVLTEVHVHTHIIMKALSYVAPIDQKIVLRNRTIV
jgi:hypothetical protein